ncbi:hypothetical protein MNB_SUP05-5-1082 [hydrothermal vent metagenome]|uniref:Phosphatidic acid phosphatase type 2/haloperoxidase domain-containing protein n=1 Tax=hydrothermal vent metagenome TaxID=652676 RepID=A0A1W1CHX7_9ZZZZ
MQINKIDIFLLPIIMLILALWVWFDGSNTSTFIYINTLSFLANKSLWANITIFGDALVLLSLLALLVRYKPRWVLAGLIAAIISGIIIQLMKYGFDIDRPTAILENTKLFLVGNPPSHRSFPSGHTASIFVFISIIFLSIRSKILAVFALCLAILVGLSRIMVAAHWPIDLLVGASIGWICGFLGIYFSKKIEQINKTLLIFMNLFILLASVLLFFHKTGYEDAFITQMIIASSMSGLSLWNLYAFRK